MKNLKTFDEFVNESENPINEAITVEEYIDISEGDTDWIKCAQNCLKYLKLNGKSVYWISSEDEDEKFDDINDFWNDNTNHENITKFIYGRNDGPDGRGSAFYGDPKIPIIKYEGGAEAFIIPISVYNTI